jgi:MoxR-like ATPase
MLHEPRYSTDEIAEFLTKRLAGQGHGKNTPAYGKQLDGYEAERLFAELRELVRQKEDLARQIIAHRRTLAEDRKSITQDDILGVLDGMRELENVHIPGVTGGMDFDQSLEGAQDAARQHLEQVNARITELMADPVVRSTYFAKIKERVTTIRVARNVDSLGRLLDKCHMATMRLVSRRSSDDLPLTAADTYIINKYNTIYDIVHKTVDPLMLKEDVFYEVKRRNLLEFRRQLLAGGFVKTESVKGEIVRILSHLHLGIPVFLRGHLGVGKTELALHVCRYYLGVEPEFISGSEEATKYDIYGRTQIGVTSGQTNSFFQEGPLVRAMKQGKPLIIDEMDGIPHSIIMRMNHVLTRRSGDTVRVQEGSDEEITIQKGYCVIATGNVKSSRYKREELDAAFLSRWWSEDVTYPPQNEVYEILTAALIDRRGDLQVKNPSDLDDLKRLTDVAAEIQRIFTGEHLDYLGEGADAARGVPAGLKKSVLSLRHLWNIVRPWKAHNFNKPVEHYILNEFIRPAVAEDQIYLVQLFCRFRFFKSWGVRQIGIPGLTETKLLAFQGRQAIPT